MITLSRLLWQNYHRRLRWCSGRSALYPIATDLAALARMSIKLAKDRQGSVMIESPRPRRTEGWMRRWRVRKQRKKRTVWWMRRRRWGPRMLGRDGDLDQYAISEGRQPHGACCIIAEASTRFERPGW